MSLKEKKEIPLYTKLPANAVIIKRTPSDKFVFCLDGNELKHLADSMIGHSGGYDCRNLKSREYFRQIDSTQTKAGFVDLYRLYWCEHWLTEDIIRHLMPKGRLGIKYENNSFVRALIYEKKSSRMLQSEFYKDESNGQTLFYSSLLLQGSF